MKRYSVYTWVCVYRSKCNRGSTWHSAVSVPLHYVRPFTSELLWHMAWYIHVLHVFMYYYVHVHTCARFEECLEADAEDNPGQSERQRCDLVSWASRQKWVYAQVQCTCVHTMYNARTFYREEYKDSPVLGNEELPKVCRKSTYTYWQYPSTLPSEHVPIVYMYMYMVISVAV